MRPHIGTKVTARQDRLLRGLLAGGRSADEVCALRLGDLDDLASDAPERSEYLDRRRRLGLPSHARAPLAVRPNGHAIEPRELDAYLRRARLTRTGMEANTSLCSGLRATRYQEVTR